MKEILRNWLFNNGICLDLDNLGQLMKDGRLLLRILTDYKVVKPELTVVFKLGVDKFECIYNLRQIRVWLELSGVNFDEEVIDKVAEGCFSTCVAVLTDLYSFLVIDGGLPIVNWDEKLAKLSSKNVEKSRFSVQKVDERALGDGVETTASVYDHCTSLVENAHVVEWYKKKHPIKRRIEREVTRSDGEKREEIDDEEGEKIIEEKSHPKNISWKLSGGDAVTNCIEEFTKLHAFHCKKVENEKQTNKIEENINKIEENVSRIDDKIPVLSSGGVNECIQEFTTLQFMKCTPVLDTTHQDSFFDYQDASNFPHPPLEYVTNLAFAKKKSVEDERRLEECERVVDIDFWSRMKQEDDEFYSDYLSGMIFKLSRFEKMLFTKVYQILHQDRIQRKRLKCFLRKTDFVSDGMEDSHAEEGLGYYQSEKKRTTELHWRLYADNLKFWYEKVYSACGKTVENIVDFAVKESVYKNLYEVEADECLLREWKSLFYQNQPLFKDNELDSFDFLQTQQSFAIDEVEEQADWLRQDIISNQNTDDYLFLEGKWSLKEEGSLVLNFTPVTREDQQTLSYIVYKLLDVKYPHLQKIEPADLPLYPVRAVVNDFNESCLEELRSLLNEQGILLVDINSAINFCVEAFVDSEQEMVEQYTLNRQSNDGPVASEKTVTILDSLDEGEKVEKMTESCGVQTSLSHLNVLQLKEDINEEAVFVGQHVLEMMKTSSDIKVQVIVDAIVAYIQSQKEVIRGWVVVNFPNTLLHASVLESTLSANRFPYHLKESVSETSFCSTVSNKESNSLNRYDELKYSKLLLNPQNKTNGNNVFSTYFTKFVVLKKLKSLNGKTAGGKFSKQHLKLSVLCSSDQINFDVLLEQPSNYGGPTLETFYRNENIHSEFCYSTLDSDTLNCLVHDLVNGALSEDDNATSLMYGSDKQDKQSEEEESRSKLAVAMSITSQVFCDSMTALNSMNDSFLFDSCHLSSDMTSQYVDLPLQSVHSVHLAELWELTTTMYLNTLLDTLYMLRVHERTVPPYFRMITQALVSCSTKPDNRQDLVTELLNDYNSIALSLLLEDDVVLEAHRRTAELTSNLVQLSDDKWSSAVEVRERLIAQQWDRQHLLAITDAYIALLQAEATRFTRTLEFLQDYYLLGLNVPLKPTNAVHSINVEGIDGKEGLNENVFKSVVDNKAKHVMLNIMKMKEACEGLMTTTENHLLAEEKRKLDNAVKEVRSNSARDKKKKNLEEEKVTADKTLQLHVDYENNCLKLKTVLHEWLDALRIEVKRAQFRVELIRRKAENYILSFEKQVRETFYQFETETERIHREEAECVRKIRKLFGTAIEEKTHILADVYYNNTDFYVRKITVEPEPEPEPIPTILVVDYESTELSLEQLEVLYLRFSILAPDGLIPKQILIEFFKDVSRTAYHGTWFWDRLTTAKLNKMFNTLFGQMEMCDWRDLLVIALEMHIPTAEDILDAKLQFAAIDKKNTEVVTMQNYLTTTLWFERELPKCPGHNLFVIKVKTFLAKLFQNGDQLVNYSALLLAFCKDVDPVVGFGKALTYLVGRCVIVYKQDEYLEQMYTDHVDTARKISAMIVEEVIGDVVEAVEIHRQGGEVSLHYDVENNQLPEFSLHYDEENNEAHTDGDEYLFETVYCPFFRRLKYCNWTTLVPVEIIRSFIKTLYSPCEFPEWMIFDFDKELAPFVRLVEANELVYVPDFVSFIFAKADFPFSSFAVYKISELIERFVIDDKIY